jgi:hypothetical protein
MSEQGSKARVLSAVLCDEIRTEDNGKLMFLGVYSGDLLAQELPANLGLSVYLDVFLPAGEVTIEVRFSGNGVTKATAEITASGPNDTRLGIPTPRLPVSFETEGELKVEVRFNRDDDWQEVLKKRLLLKATFEREVREFARSRSN